MIRDTVIDSRSIRSFDESRPVRKEQLLEFLDTARLCPSAGNRQPLRYRLVTEREEVEELLGLTRWAALLPDTKLPPEGHHPTAFIAVCCDTEVCEDVHRADVDLGIAAQTIALQATESGIGSCMIGAFDPKAVSGCLLIPKRYKPTLLLAFGAPDESVMICALPKDGCTAYFRDKLNFHFVPKRELEDIILE